VLNPDREVQMTINVDSGMLLRCCTSYYQCQLSSCCECCAICDCDDTVYSLRANDYSDLIGRGTVIGEVRKEYPGFCCPDPDHYQLTWPQDLDVKMKALVMSAIFLMDKQWDENYRNNLSSARQSSLLLLYLQSVITLL